MGLSYIVTLPKLWAAAQAGAPPGLVSRRDQLIEEIQLAVARDILHLAHLSNL